MPRLNPRTTKFKEIIKKINTGTTSDTPMENDSDNKVITEDSANKTKLNAADQSSVDSLNFSTVVTQQSRNRNNSTDSGNSNRSGRDFSPASDDDPEYKLSPNDHISSESDTTKTHLPKIKQKQKTVAEVHNVSTLNTSPSLSRKSRSSSAKSSNSSSSSSSGSSTSSASSSSSSRSSSTSSRNDSMSVNSNSATPSKRNCISPKVLSPEITSCKLNKSASALQIIAMEYGSESFSDSDGKIINNIPIYNPSSLKSLAIEQINKTTHLNNITPETISDTHSATQTRKRKRGNKKKLAKLLRNKGLQYSTSSKQKKVIPERKIGIPCGMSCRLKCSEKFTEESRRYIFNNYWQMSSLSKQRDFISKHMTEIKPKYQYKKIFNNRKAKHAFYLTASNEKKRVCKIFFKNTLGINDRPIRTVIAKLNLCGIVEPDLRGKHDNHGTKTSSELLDRVRKHIASIPRIESHYLRKQTTREFIEGGKTLTDLYRDYKKDCEIEGLDYVKLHIIYRKVFKEDFNISFFVPKKDQCEDCVAYENANLEEKEKMNEEYTLHLKEKELSREEKKRDKELIDDNNIVACYDLQAILQVPKGDVSSFYYKSRLNCLNFTICELKADCTHCYFWTEVEGQKGANEIGSCVFKFLQKKSATASSDLNIIFYSDNCCGQQKNQFVFSMYLYAVANLPNIASITHKFLIKGHTQNEGDSVHSMIERQIKKKLRSGPIYVPDQYISAIRDAKKRGNKYNVVEMAHHEFYDIKKLQEFKLTKNTEGGAIKVGDIKVLKVEKSDSNHNVRVFYKTSYSDETFKEINLLKLRRIQPQLVPLYNNKLPLAENKKKDLKDLIKKNAILPYYVSSFYNNIL